MNDLIQTYNQLSELQRRQLIAYADMLLLKQKAKQSDGDLTGWKEKIKKVSTWSDNDIKELEANAKNLNQWKVQEW